MEVPGFAIASLDGLARKDIQNLAKLYKIKANGKTSQIIDELKEYYAANISTTVLTAAPEEYHEQHILNVQEDGTTSLPQTIPMEGIIIRKDDSAPAAMEIEVSTSTAPTTNISSDQAVYFSPEIPVLLEATEEPSKAETPLETAPPMEIEAPLATEPLKEIEESSLQLSQRKLWKDSPILKGITVASKKHQSPIPMPCMDDVSSALLSEINARLTQKSIAPITASTATASVLPKTVTGIPRFQGKSNAVYKRTQEPTENLKSYFARKQERQSNLLGNCPSRLTELARPKTATKAERPPSKVMPFHKQVSGAFSTQKIGIAEKLKVKQPTAVKSAMAVQMKHTTAAKTYTGINNKKPLARLLTNKTLQPTC